MTGSRNVWCADNSKKQGAALCIICQAHGAAPFTPGESGELSAPGKQGSAVNTPREHVCSCQSGQEKKHTVRLVTERSALTFARIWAAAGLCGRFLPPAQAGERAQGQPELLPLRGALQSLAFGSKSRELIWCLC